MIFFWAFIGLFLPHPILTPVTPNITWARGSKQLTPNYLVQKGLTKNLNNLEREKKSCVLIVWMPVVMRMC